MVARNEHALALSLSQILQKTDRILTGNEKVKVTANVLSPDSFSVGNDIALGFRGLNITDQEDITCAIGLNYHELAHTCLTPRNTGDVFMVRSEKTNSIRYIHSAFNYLEDARIETLFGARYDAMRYYFTVTFIAKVLRDDDALSQHVQRGGGDPRLLTLSAHLLAHGRRFLPSDIRNELRNRAVNDWTNPGEYDRIVRAEKIIDVFRTMTRRDLHEDAEVSYPKWPGKHTLPRFILAASRLHDLFPELFDAPNDHGKCAQTAATGSPHGGISQTTARETAQDKKKEEQDSQKAKQDQDDDYEEIEVPDQEDDEDDEDDDQDQDDQESDQDDENRSGEDQDQEDGEDAQDPSQGDDDHDPELGDGDDDQEDGDGDDQDDDGSSEDGSNRPGEDQGGQEDGDDGSDAQSPSGGSGDPSQGDDDGDRGDGGTGDASGDGADGDQDGDASGAGAGTDQNAPLTDTEMRDAMSSVMSSVIDNSVISSEVDRIAQDVARMGEQSDENFVTRMVPADGETIGAIAELSTILSGLQDRVAPGWNYGSDHGRLNVGRVMAGADFEEIYDEWDEGREDDASSEIVFLLDQSISMKDDPIWAASRLLHTLRSALLTIDANVTIYGFSTRIVNVLKGRDDKDVTDEIPIYGTIQGTDIKNALSYAVDAFNESDAKNRILIVLTDGIWESQGYGSGLDDTHRHFLSQMNAQKVLCFINKEAYSGHPIFGGMIEDIEREFDFAFDAKSPTDLLAPIATVVERVVTNSVS